MAAFLIAHAKIKDPVKLQQYGAGAVPTLAAFGGEVVARGKVAAVLAGDHHGHTAFIAKFPDVLSAQSWYNSPAYQALIPVRNEAMEPTFVVIEAL
jgi:uncharacterized protein (DUF1330 family)